MTSSPTWRGQDIEAQRAFIRAVSEAFAAKLEELSVTRRGRGSVLHTPSVTAAADPQPREGSSC
jgi:hypothetical protein